ncbi:MAG: sn-glycerol-3-phosphate ABC transporter ATP-binding protein UgpC [Planctomycetota bacterium]|jgi:multiple sugar transport system ATP-binding protein|nr:sn-glycerol-3-phosphate ABC transporter ATP-binding protein UgpC [Planctomycetota bacterium]
MAKVELKNIEKTYEGDVRAVSAANVVIEDREFVVFVGPSGCGKSTTLRMIAGLEEITSGELWIDGELVNDIPPKDRNIAMVFQNYALYPHMTVYENMAFGLRIRKIANAEIDKRVQEAAKILSIQEYLHRKPRALSGGQRQRVAVGRAIVRNPKVFLFDEPLSNLDAKLRVQMRTEIAKLHNRLKATMIYVTHDQVEAMTMGDKIVVMKDGVIQQIGSPLLLYDHPCNHFVAGFIGSPPMNFLDGKLRRDGERLLAEGEGFSFVVADNHLEALLKAPHPEVVIGIRPEHMGIAAQDQIDNILSAHVTVIEELGAEAHMYMSRRADDMENLIARLEQRHGYRIGDNIRLSPDMERVRYFDAVSGEALLGVIGPIRMSSRRSALAQG